MTARTAMDAALNEFSDTGRCTPCADDNRFTSEDRTDRDAALPLCTPCPLLQQCRVLAGEEKPTWGVYGGRDHTKTPKPRKAAA